MAASAEEVERAAERERRTSYLELFFDLVVVFAITQVTTLLLEDMSAAGFARSALALGIILFAVAAKKVLAHPEDPLSQAGRVALGLGIAVFLAGFALGRFRALRPVAWERMAGAAAAIVLALALDGLTALALMAVVVAVLAAATGLETVRLREFRARMRAG